MKFSLNFLKKERTLADRFNDFVATTNAPGKRMRLQVKLMMEQSDIISDLRRETKPVAPDAYEKLADLMESCAAATSAVEAMQQPEKLKGDMDFEEFMLVAREAVRLSKNLMSSMFDRHPEVKDVIKTRQDKARTEEQQAVDSWLGAGCPADKDIRVAPIRLKAPAA